MNFKIIQTPAPLPDVLAYRDITKDGEQVVKILAIGTMGDNDDYFVEEIIKFPNGDAARWFIVDFSEAYAKSFCERNGIKY